LSKIPFACYFDRLLAEVPATPKPGYGNCRACGNRGKTKPRFSTVPTALGKLDQECRVSHSSHSPYGWHKLKQAKQPNQNQEMIARERI